MKFKIASAWIVIFLIGIIPAILFLLFGSGNYSSTLYTLGRISGLIGMTFFALALMLSTRAKWIEYLFGGLDKVYPVHSTLGATSFVLLLLHPLLLVTKFIPDNLRLAAIYLLPGGLISVDLGIFALLGMIVLLMVTLYGKLKYNIWKFSHEFLGVSFILAVLHIFLVRTTVAVDYIFKGYYVYATIVSIIGLGGFIYSLSRNKLLGKRYVIKKIDMINTCFEITLRPLDKGNAIGFRSGQFIFVRFRNIIVGMESHPFSITSPTGNGSMRIIAKNLGDFTSRLGKLREGNEVIVEGPYGKFHGGSYADEVWVAGGIGITPFLGLAEDFRDSRTGHVDLYYSVKSREEFVHLEELQGIAKSNKNFRVFPWMSDEQGFLTIDDIAKRGQLKNREYYLCGPESLKAAIRNGLLKKHVKNVHIYDERFAFK